MDMHFEGVIFQTHAAELARRLRHPFPPFCVLDLRPAGEFARGRVPGALRINPEDLERGLPAGTDAATEFFLVGRGPDDPAVRAAAVTLRRHGARRRVEVPGGMLEWRQAGFEEERGEPREPARAA